MRAALDLASFDEVWKTIHEKHFDPTFNGVDWKAVRDELRPEVEKAGSRKEARAVIVKMIERLRQSHFGIIPSDLYGELEAEGKRKLGGGQTGIDVRVTDGQVLITAVEADSPAANAGIKTGWIITKVDGEELGPALAKVEAAYKDSTQREFRETRVALSRMGGPVGGKVKLELKDGDDQVLERELVLAEPKGTPATLGNLPTFYVRFDSRMLRPDVLYVRLSVFFDPVRVVAGLGKALKEHPEAKGLVLDIRGNPGGLGAMAMGLGGWLVEDGRQKLGTMSTRDSQLHFALNPRADAFTGPVALLIDGSSLSTSEVLAGGLKDLGRARLFGSRTGGAALPSVVVKLPNGDGFQYAIANYVSVGGKVLEGQGVAPDESVAPTRAALLRGEDPVLDAAVKWLGDTSRKAD